MQTLALDWYRESYFVDECELPRAGSSLENPFVFDATARELKAMAARGLLEVVSEREDIVAGRRLISALRFRRPVRHPQHPGGHRG
jgi:hypothetical protein